MGNLLDLVEYPPARRRCQQITNWESDQDL